MMPHSSRRWLVCLGMMLGLVLRATPTAQQCYLDISAFASGIAIGHDESGNPVLGFAGSGFDYSWCEGQECAHVYAIAGIVKQQPSQQEWANIEGGGTEFSSSVTVTPGEYKVESLFYVGCWVCAQQTFIAPASSQTILLQACDPDIATVRQEYFDHNHPYRPECHEFTQSVPYPSHYGFSNWNVSNQHAWAILRENMVANVWCVGTNYGEARPLTSGYRNPVRNSQITSSGSFIGPHTYGWAADLDTPDYPDDTMYNQLRNIAKQSTCGSACVEPFNLSRNHIHIDYRTSTCPNDW